MAAACPPRGPPKQDKEDPLIPASVFIELEFSPTRALPAWDAPHIKLCAKGRVSSYCGTDLVNKVLRVPLRLVPMDVAIYASENGPTRHIFLQAV